MFAVKMHSTTKNDLPLKLTRALADEPKHKKTKTMKIFLNITFTKVTYG